MSAKQPDASAAQDRFVVMTRQLSGDTLPEPPEHGEARRIVGELPTTRKPDAVGVCISPGCRTLCMAWLCQRHRKPRAGGGR